MARSETNSVGNLTYADLTLTHYPSKIDSRTANDSGYNPNMKGFENVVDYNMAEHVNALADAVMAIERVLGIRPQFDKDGIDRQTVQNRMRLMESKDYDSRYGGIGWSTTQTLVGHKHSGAPGGPSRIDLETEVQKKLGRDNIDLTYNSARSLTGADLAISHSSNTPILYAVNDKLSVTAGGQVKGDTSFTGKMNSRMHVEWDTGDVSTGASVADTSASLNTAKRYTGTATQTVLQNEFNDLFNGTYTVGIRVKTNEKVNGNLLTLTFSDVNTDAKVIRSERVIRGTDFANANQWETFYLVVEHNSTHSLKKAELKVIKSSTTSATVNLDFDYAFITPVHPAVYDI